jgi:hypothetical protein
MYKLSDSIDRKFTEVFDASEWEIETEDGFQPIISSNKTIEYEVFRITLSDGKILECADNHIIMTLDGQEVFAKDSLNREIKTVDGNATVVMVENLQYSEEMYDLSIDSVNHTYYANGILSHNTQTSAAYILWYTIFQDVKTVAIMANKASAAREVLSRYQQMYEYLPIWLQQGIKTWNKGDVELENGSKVFTSATTTTGPRGRSINMLYIDEAAFIPTNIAEQFFTSVYPTISAGQTTKILLSSTPKGYNHFWKFWTESEQGNNDFKNLFIPYWEIPGRDAAWAEEQKRLLGELKYNQEVLCAWLGSSDTLINADAMRLMTPIKPIHSRDGLDTFDRPRKDRIYVTICDVAKGVGADYSAFSVIDITDMPYKQVAKYRDNNISPLLYPSIIYKVATEYNQAYVLLEINVSEQVAHILFYEMEYENVLFVARTNKGQQVSSGFSKGVTTLGVNTDKKVKRIGCSNLKALIEEQKLIVQDADTISEFGTFIQNKDSYAADDGYHDDLVMPLVLFAWFTSNPAFRDFSDISLRHEMYARRMQAIEEELVPMGFFNDGTPDAEAPWNF